MNDATPIVNTKRKDSDMTLDFFYSYGYKGKEMKAVRAPFAMAGDAGELLGSRVLIDGLMYEIHAIARQISGPIAKGELIGVEARLIPQTSAI